MKDKAQRPAQKQQPTQKSPGTQATAAGKKLSSLKGATFAEGQTELGLQVQPDPIYKGHTHETTIKKDLPTQAALSHSDTKKVDKEVDGAKTVGETTGKTTVEGGWGKNKKLGLGLESGRNLVTTEKVGATDVSTATKGKESFGVTRTRGEDGKKATSAKAGLEGSTVVTETTKEGDVTTTEVTSKGHELDGTYSKDGDGKRSGGLSGSLSRGHATTTQTKTADGEKTVTDAYEAGVGGSFAQDKDGKRTGGVTGSLQKSRTVAETHKDGDDTVTNSVTTKGGLDAAYGTDAKSLAGTVGRSTSKTVESTDGDKKVTTTTTGSNSVGGNVAQDKEGKVTGGASGSMTRGRSVTEEYVQDGKKIVATKGVTGGLDASTGSTGSAVSGRVGTSSSKSTESMEGDTKVTVVDTGSNQIGGKVAEDKDGKRTGAVTGALERGRTVKKEFEADGKQVVTEDGVKGGVNAEYGSDKKTVGGTVGTTSKRTEAFKEGDKDVQVVTEGNQGITATGSQAKDGTQSGSVRGDIGRARTVKTSHTTEDGKTVQTEDKLSGTLGAEYGTDKKGLTAGVADASKETVTYTDANGQKVTETSGLTKKASGDVSQDKEGKLGGGITASVDKTTGRVVEHTTADGSKVTDRQQRSGNLNAGYRHGTGATLGAGLTSESSTTTVSADGKTTTVSDKDKAALSGTISTKDGVGVNASRSHVGSQTTTQIDDKTTATTTTGKASADANASVKRDKSGAIVAHAGANAEATALSGNVTRSFGPKGKEGSMEAGYEVGSAKANASADATITKDKINLDSNVGASVTLVGGNAKITTPPLAWKMFGEDVKVIVTAGVSAAVLAEAKGKMNLTVDRGSKFEAKMGGSASAFAGARAGVEIGGKFIWDRQPDYTKIIKGFAKSLPGQVDDWLVDKVPDDVWSQIASLLVGKGPAEIISAMAGVEGTAGIGGEASFNLGLSGGKISFSGNLQGTIGLGVGTKTKVDLDAVQGVQFLGILGMRGHSWLVDKLAEAGSWFANAIQKVQKATDDYMESLKAQGGFTGAAASVADFFGDKVFGLW